MNPDLWDNQYVVAEQFGYFRIDPSVGDIVVLKNPFDNKKLIKRVTAKIKDYYFVEGDNKNASFDSRHFGFIHRENILSRVIKAI